jgi:hypothetical protein
MEKNPQITNPRIRMRHPIIYLVPSSPDPTLSESGKGTCRSLVSTLGLTGSGSRLRASPLDRSTMACSPSGERRPPVSRHVTTPPPLAGWRAGYLTLAHFWVRTKAERGEMALGFQKLTTHGFCCYEISAWPFILDERSTMLWAGFSTGGQANLRPRPSLHSENSTRDGPLLA